MRFRKLAILRNDLSSELAKESGPVADEGQTLDGTVEMIDIETALRIADDFMVLAGLGPIARLRTALPFSRPCYDKPHRCPGWAGGGWRFAMVTRCSNGSLAPIDYRRRYWFGARCPECEIYVLPIAVQLVDPTYLWWRIRHPRWPYWASIRYWRFHLRRVFQKGNR